MEHYETGVNYIGGFVLHVFPYFELSRIGISWDKFFYRTGCHCEFQTVYLKRVISIFNYWVDSKVRNQKEH